MSRGSSLPPTSLGPGLPIVGWTLDNGLRLLVQPDPTAPVVCVQTWLGVGSRHERRPKTGIAHLLEHLMFLGAPRVAGERHGSGAFDRLMEEAGVDTNAATWCDWTFYTDTGPADALPRILALEADRLDHLELDEAVFRTERDVVRNERQETVDDDPDAVVSEQLHLLAFDDHPYRHPTIGLEADIGSLTLEDVRAFHEAFYQPANATLVVAGDVDPEAVVRLVEGSFAELPGAPLPGESPPSEGGGENRRLRLSLETDTAKLVLGLAVPGLADASHPVAVLLNEVLFGTRGGRAHRALVEEQGVCASVYGDVGHFRWDSLWEIELAVHEADAIATAEAAFDEVLAGLDTITDDEVARAAARLELRTWQSLIDVVDRAEQIGFYQTLQGAPAGAAQRIEAFQSVSSADLRTFGAALIRRAAIEVVPAGSGR